LSQNPEYPIPNLYKNVNQDTKIDSAMPHYSGQNLRGRSFKGQNLERVNFSYADIRGADFSNANLTGVDFSHAQARLRKRWAIFLVCVSWVLSGISGFFSAFSGVLKRSR